MVEHNILETIKDPTDATLGGADVARSEADQLVDKTRIQRLQIIYFARQFAIMLVKRTQWVIQLLYSHRLNQRKFTSEMAKIDFHVFFTQCSLGHKYLRQKVYCPARLMSRLYCGLMCQTISNLCLAIRPGLGIQALDPSRNQYRILK